MTDRPPLPYDFMPAVPSFELHSDDVAEGQLMSENQVFDQWGMTGGNISPSLSWSGFPGGTKSFAVTCYDPDSGSVHLIMLSTDPDWQPDRHAAAGAPLTAPAEG